MKMSLKAKVSTGVLFIAIILAASAVFVSYRIYANTMDAHYETLAINLAKTAASVVDREDTVRLTDDVMAAYRANCSGDVPPDFDGFTDADWADYYADFAEAAASPAYAELFDTLHTIKEDNNALWMYICYMDEVTGKAVYIIDADTPDNANPAGYCDPIEAGNLALMQQGIYDFPAYITNYQEYGWLCSASAAITDEDGTVIANAYVDLSMNDVMADRQNFLLRLGAVLLAATLALIVVLSVAISRTVVSPINKLATAAASFVSDKQGGGQGSAISQLRIHTGDEIENLSDSIKQMELEINSYITDLTRVTAERERIGAELDVAKNIQASMLPCIFPAFPGRLEFDIYATMTPAKEVGGDFYDFFLIDDDHLAVVMADVSGKGVPAAMFMMISKTLLKSAAQTGLSPSAILEKVNNQLCENNEQDMFVTVWLGILEISTGHLRCANAGHEYPAIRRKGGAFELFQDPHSFVLAGMECLTYKEYELTLGAGDRLFVYTDGVAEATDVCNQLYGTDRLLNALNSEEEPSCQALLQTVHRDVNAFVGMAPQFDDITMLCLKMNAVEDDMKELRMEPALERLEEATAFFETRLSDADAPMGVIAQVNVAVDEIFSNIARYSGASYALLGCAVDGNRVTLRFTDDGKAYDPTAAPDPDVELSADEREIGGLGIFMVKQSMDTTEYEYKDGCNVLTLKKSW